MDRTAHKRRHGDCARANTHAPPRWDTNADAAAALLADKVSKVEIRDPRPPLQVLFVVTEGADTTLFVTFEAARARVRAHLKQTFFSPLTGLSIARMGWDLEALDDSFRGIHTFYDSVDVGWLRLGIAPAWDSAVSYEEEEEWIGDNVAWSKTELTKKGER